MGAGPGAPDLLTLRAVRVIEQSQVIICPRSATARSSLALDIIRDFVRDQEIIQHVYPMKRSPEQIQAAWAGAAGIITEHCLAGRTVCQVTLGDPHIYSTCAYVLPLLENSLGLERIHIVPGIAAFQSSAASFTEPLTSQEDRLMLMPGTDLEAVRQALTCCETLVLYKAGRNLAAIAELLEGQGLADRSRVVFNSGFPGRERVFAGLDQALGENPGYLACVIVYSGRRVWEAHD